MRRRRHPDPGSLFLKLVYDALNAPEQMRRWRKLATTWFAKSAALTYQCATSERAALRVLAGYEAERLLEDVLGEAEILVAIIPEGAVAECEERAKKLASMLRARRLASAMENTTGRTDEEAALFRERAAALRAPKC